MDGLFVGRFQPFHLGHLHALEFALSKADRLWLGLGSANREPDKTNPFTAQEREAMITSSISDSMRRRISIYHIPDLDNHARWVRMIDEMVPEFGMVFSNDPLTDHLYSERKVEVLHIPFLRREDLSGTRIRSMMAGRQGWEDLVPEGTREFLVRHGAGGRLGGL